MKAFYQKYIEIDFIMEELDSLDLSEGERHHLASLLDSSLHHVILDEILSNLNTVDKKLFLTKLNEDPENEKLMEFLNEKIDGVEERIKKVSNQLVKEMHEDVIESKKLKVKSQKL